MHAALIGRFFANALGVVLVLAALFVAYAFYLMWRFVKRKDRRDWRDT